MKKTILSIFFALALIVFLIQVIPTADSQQVSVCCEKTNYGAWCQNSDPGQCDSDYQETPSSCESTSFCRLGTCYDSTEGICMENTPQRACQESGGVWSEGSPDEVPQCQTGCCVLGNQAAFTTLTRCKKLSSFYSLETDFRRNIASEFECIAITQSQDKGACVYEVDFEKTCKFTTRAECSSVKDAEFYKDYLCSAEELATNCGPTQKTTCVEGKDEVYFVDSCGNPANIYDASRVNDKSYWKKIVPKTESCGFNDLNANSDSASCGNCDYLSGSICKNYKGIKNSRRPTYGEYICKNLDCPDTFNGKSYKHGESWCVNDNNNPEEDSVGSRHFRHICVAGEEIVEPCADLRQEVCIEDSIETDKGKFSQAACRVNRWQSCINQKSKDDCLDTDKRDCKWLGKSETSPISCVPLISPGLNFWEDNKEGESSAGKVCSLASVKCEVEFKQKGLFSSKDAEKNKECLTKEWREKQKETCMSIGDCKGKTNFIGVKVKKERNK